MLRTMLISAAAIAISGGAANAQFLLMADDNDQKMVVNQWAGETAAESSVFERRAVSALRAPAEAYAGPSHFLTPGAPLGADANDHKRVVGQ